MPTRALARLFFLLLLGACPGMAQAPIEEPKLEGEQQQKLQDLPPPPGRFLNVPKETLEEPPPPDGPATLSKEQVTRSVLGFVVLLILAYLAGHPKLAQFEESLHVGSTTLTGFLFVLLGLLAATGTVKVLTSTVIQAIEPVVPFCLGWIGFRHGFGYDRELLLEPPPANAVVTALLAPALLALGGAAALIAALNPGMLADRAVWRDLAVFALACGTAAIAPIQRIERGWGGAHASGRLVGFVKMEHFGAIALLMMLAVYFRPQGEVVAWQLPGSAWLFIVFGLGSSMGILSWAMFRSTPDGPPFIVVLLGSVALCAGMASFLRLAVIPACFIAGLIVANLPGTSRDQVRAVLNRTQRPALFVLFVIAGALWRPAAWQGWALLAIFLAARLGGNGLAVRLIARWVPGAFDSEQRRALTYSPTGALSIAVVLSARDLYPDSQVPYTLTAVIMGALLGEALLQSRYWKIARAKEVAAP